MCIAFLSTSHPNYSLILINNRDEFLTRPTAPLSWHPEYPFLLSGRDLLRSAHGTWLGITTTGLIAVLTNFRENNPNPDARSRGEVINAFLTQPAETYTSVEKFFDGLGDVSDVGGFTMLCGRVGEDLGVVSNRTVDGRVGRVREELSGTGVIVGVSNGAFGGRGDKGWGKVERGREILGEVFRRDVERRVKGESGREGEFVEELFGLLSTDTLPKRPVDKSGMGEYMKEFRNSIFIPAVGEGGGDGLSGVYGTQKQSIVLVDMKGHVKFVERTLYDDEAKFLKDERDRSFEFGIEGWRR